MIDIREANKKDNERIGRMMKSFGVCIEKDRKLQTKLFEVCRRTNRKELEVLTEASKYIKRKNKDLYDKMNDPNTPKTERDWIRFQFFIEEYLMALA